MGKYVDFDRKIGWSDVISILALVIAGLSLWTAGRGEGPQIVISRDSRVGGPYLDKSSQRWRFFGYERVTMSNVGGRSVTLLGIRLPNKSPFPRMITGYIADGRKIEARTEILLLDDFVEDVRNDPDIISGYKPLSLERLGALNRLVPPGGTLPLVIGLRHDAYTDGQPVPTHCSRRWSFPSLMEVRSRTTFTLRCCRSSEPSNMALHPTTAVPS